MSYEVNVSNFCLVSSFSNYISTRPFVAVREYVNPCQPSPCGPNSQCREINQQPVCSCLPSYLGNPPSCRPECTASVECSLDRACVNRKCVDPCPGVCGLNSQCKVRNHSPICYCNNGFTGDAFTRCYPIPRKILKAFPVSTFLISVRLNSSRTTSTFAE